MNTLSKDAATWHEIGESAQNQRIDNFLRRTLKGVPSSHVYRILRSGEVRVNSRRVDQTYRLQAGDRVRIPPVSSTARAPASGTAQPARPMLERHILLEDNHLIVLDKPSGMAVHGGSGVSFGVVEQLRRERPQQPVLELVHRLDRETSGLLLIAKK